MRHFELPGRSPVYAANGMVATTNPLAALAAIDILRANGNAVDAAIAAAAVLGVTEPYNIGLGADTFVMIARGGSDKIIAYNGSGYAPDAATAQWYWERDIREISPTSAHAVTVPGVVDAWTRIVLDYGTKGIDELFSSAIRLAREGYPVFDVVHYYWSREVERLQSDATAARIFLPNGACPEPATLHCQPELARSLESIAQGGRGEFYEGAIAEDLVGHLRANGGLHTLADFSSFEGEYVEPICTTYRGFDVHECPPNGQGIVALMMLNVLSGFDLSGLDPIGADRLHLEIEAAKLVYRDRDVLLGDPGHTNIPVESLLSTAYAQQLQSQIEPKAALSDLPPSPFPPHRDTTYVCVVDRDCTAVSLIGSLFHCFGSGLVGPNSGIVLQNRGLGFVTEPGHANAIGPRKRPLHTIIPGMACQNGRVVMPFGVVGGRYQPFGHVHVLSNLFDFGLDPQEAIDLGRVYHEAGMVEVERSISDRVAMDLAGYGHRVVRRSEGPNSDGGPIGAAHLIKIDWDKGVLIGAADSRTDGCALGY